MGKQRLRGTASPGLVTWEETEAQAEHALVPCRQHKDRVTRGRGEGLSFQLETHLLISTHPVPLAAIPHHGQININNFLGGGMDPVWRWTKRLKGK